ncbi:MAG: hypothetical protein CFH37_00896, partial [Alphaproteobacteria bacterium MarineAlpha9_Bin7]
CPSQAFLEAGVQVGQPLHRLIGQQQSHDEREKGARCRFTGDHPVAAVNNDDADGHTTQGFHDRAGPGPGPRGFEVQLENSLHDAADPAFFIAFHPVGLDHADSLEGLFQKRCEQAHFFLGVGRDLAHAPPQPQHRKRRHGKHENRNHRQLPILEEHHGNQSHKRQQILAEPGQHIGHRDAHLIDIDGETRNQLAGRIVVEKTDVHPCQVREQAVLVVGDDAKPNETHQHRLTVTGEPLDQKGEKLSYVQGVGIGHRPRLAGGIGILRDSSGNDSYFAEKFAQGQGYFFGFGMLEDIAGNDTYTSSRYAQGQGSFAGIGLLADLDGEDDYRLEVGVGQGMGLDTGIGLLVDYAGDDRYAAPSLAQGSSTGNGFGLLADAEGSDIYYLDKPGLGWGRGRDARGMPGLPFLLDIGGKAHYILSGELMLDVDLEGLGGPLARFKLSQLTAKKFECPDPRIYAAPMVGPLIDRLSRSAPRFGVDETALQEFVGLSRLMPNAIEELLEQVKVEDSDLVVNLSALVRCYLEDADASGKIKIQHVLIKTLHSDHALALVAITLLGIIPPSSDILFDISERSQHHSDCGVRANALLLLRYVNGTTERVKSLARRSLQDSCWQVKSVCLSLLAHLEGTSRANVSRVTFNELPDVLKHRAKVSSDD